MRRCHRDRVPACVPRVEGRRHRPPSPPQHRWASARARRRAHRSRTGERVRDHRQGIRSAGQASILSIGHSAAASDRADKVHSWTSIWTYGCQSRSCGLATVAAPGLEPMTYDMRPRPFASARRPSSAGRSGPPVANAGRRRFRSGFNPPGIPPRSRLDSTGGIDGPPRRSRKPLGVVRRLVGSNPTPSAQREDRAEPRNRCSDARSSHGRPRRPRSQFAGGSVCSQ
jgi:hypothetical protein